MTYDPLTATGFQDFATKYYQEQDHSFSRSAYDLSLASRMCSAAGWHPDDCYVYEDDKFITVVQIDKQEVRMQAKDVHKTRLDDLGVAP